MLAVVCCSIAAPAAAGGGFWHACIIAGVPAAVDGVRGLACAVAAAEDVAGVDSVCPVAGHHTGARWAAAAGG